MSTTSKTRVCVMSETEELQQFLHVPQINLNGTSAESLQEECRDAARAIRDALKALNAMTVNGRDWQFDGGPEEYRLARAEHDERRRKLTQVGEEILAIYNAINDQ